MDQAYDERLRRHQIEALMKALALIESGVEGSLILGFLPDSGGDNPIQQTLIVAATGPAAVAHISALCDTVAEFDEIKERFPAGVTLLEGISKLIKQVFGFNTEVINRH